MDAWIYPKYDEVAVAPRRLEKIVAYDPVYPIPTGLIQHSIVQLCPPMLKIGLLFEA